jgi:hypothetical protein
MERKKSLDSASGGNPLEGKGEDILAGGGDNMSGAIANPEIQDTSVDLFR